MQTGMKFACLSCIHTRGIYRLKNIQKAYKLVKLKFNTKELNLNLDDEKT